MDPAKFTPGQKLLILMIGLLFFTMFGLLLWLMIDKWMPRKAPRTPTAGRIMLNSSVDEKLILYSFDALRMDSFTSPTPGRIRWLCGCSSETYVEGDNATVEFLPVAGVHFNPSRIFHLNRGISLLNRCIVVAASGIPKGGGVLFSREGELAVSVEPDYPDQVVVRTSDGPVMVVPIGREDTDGALLVLCVTLRSLDGKYSLRVTGRRGSNMRIEPPTSVNLPALMDHSAVLPVVFGPTAMTLHEILISTDVLSAETQEDWIAYASNKWLPLVI